MTDNETFDELMAVVKKRAKAYAWSDEGDYLGEYGAPGIIAAMQVVETRRIATALERLITLAENNA